MKKTLLSRATLLLVLLTTAPNAFAYDPLNRWMLFNGNYVFDGSRVNSSPNASGAAINAMAMDATGNVWLGFTGKGVRMWDGKKLSGPAIPKDNLVLNADITCMATDSKGTVWVGTSEGLAKWDGSAWTNITPDVIGMNAVRDIVVTPTDKVYISGVIADEKSLIGGALAFYNGQGWTNWNSIAATAPDTLLQNLVLDANNHLWMTLGKHNKGLAKFDGKNWKTFNIGSGLPSDEITTIATNKSGKMFFAAPKGILEYDGTNWSLKPYSNGFGSKLTEELGKRNGQLDVNSLMVEDNGALWLGLRNGGVYNMRNVHSDRFYEPGNSLVPAANVMQILVDPTGAKWMLTGERSDYWAAEYFGKNRKYRGSSVQGAAGIAVLKEWGHLTDSKWLVYDEQSFDVKQYGMPFDFGEDKTGNLWYSGSAGLIQMKDGGFKAFRYKNEFQSSFNRMYMAPDGKIYLNTSINGIKVYDKGDIFDFAKWPNMGGVMNMTYDAKGNFWSAGTGGLSLRKGEEWETFDKKNGNLPSVVIYTVFSDSKGRLWAGTAKGLILKTDAGFGKQEVEFPSDDIRCISEDSRGRLWFGSNRGVSILDGTAWTHISKVESPKLKNFQVNSIVFDKSTNAWMATEGDGLLQFDGITWTQYDAKNTATLFDHIDAVKVAADGKIYVSSGLSEFQLRSADFMMPNATGDQAIENGLKTRIRANDPKKVFVVITP